MLEIFQALRWGHIAVGSVALTVFWIPAIAPKGGRLHVRAGWVYVACMSVVVLSAFAMSGMAFADPLGVRHLTHTMTTQETSEFIHRSQLFAAFLAYLAGVTLAAGWHGVSVLRTRQNPPALRTTFSFALNTIVVLGSGAMLVLGLRDQNWVLVGMSPVGVLVSGGNLAYLRRGPQSRMDWWYQHLASMIGTGIAGYTAFFVFGGAHLLPAISQSKYYAVLWVLPTIIGSVAITLTITHYKKKFHENVKPPLGGNLAQHVV